MCVFFFSAWIWGPILTGSSGTTKRPDHCSNWFLRVSTFDQKCAQMFNILNEHLYKSTGFKQYEGNKKKIPKWPIWKPARGPRASRFRDHIQVSFWALRSGPLTGFLWTPNRHSKGFFLQKEAIFLVFLWSSNWLSGKVSSGPASGCPYIYICCRAENPSKIWGFLSWKSVQGCVENPSKIFFCLFFPSFIVFLLV